MARFGFPEVTLGLLPGAGGTQRLPPVSSAPPTGWRHTLAAGQGPTVTPPKILREMVAKGERCYPA